MKTSFLFCTAVLALCAACAPKVTVLDGDSQYCSFAPDGIPFVVADSMWQADQHGNHRAVVQVDGAQGRNAVQVRLPWRRPDLRPETKKVVVVDARSGKEIRNVRVSDFSAESATVAFEPVAGDGLYYVYYLPYKYRKGWDDARYGNPWNDYLPPVYEAEENWTNSLTGEIHRAKAVRFESRSRFDAFTPMGLAATRRETDSLKNVYAGNPVLFPEDRAFPIRLTNSLPARWVKTGAKKGFSGVAQRNE